MQIKLLSIGTKMPHWINLGFAEYAGRMPADCTIKLIEINSIKRNKNSDLNKIMAMESEALLAATDPADHVIALDRVGTELGSLDLAKLLADWRTMGQNVSLLIGGPEGLSEECLKRAKARWSLSKLTLPHPLVRIVVAEQLYRAYSILSNHPYHR